MNKGSVLAVAFLSLCATSALSYTDSLWIDAGSGNAGELVPVEVWLQYEGGGLTDSLEGFDILLTWDASICTVEAITVGPDFSAWDFIERIDNNGVNGPPSVPKISISAYTFGPPIGPPFVERGTHLAATVDFRMLPTAQFGDSTYIDTLMQAFSPPLYLGFMDKRGLFTYTPSYGGDYITVPFACGDCNGDSCVTFLDVSYLTDFLGGSGPTPLGSGDVNQDGFVDVADVVYLLRYLFDGGPPPCGIEPLACSPRSWPADSVMIGDAVICCTTTTASLPISVKNTSSLIGITFTLEFDTTFVVCDSATFSSGIPPQWGSETRIDSAAGTVLMAAWTSSLVSPQYLSPGTHEAATIWFSSRIPSQAGDTLSPFGTPFIPPQHTLSLVNSGQDLLSPSITTDTLVIAPHCGDVNADCRITVADANYIAGYVYRAGPAPICEGDVNLDGRITIADATYLITYIYRGGAPPCHPPRRAVH
ncbi:hypothetical protein AMJ40_06790 [candidate division TA06 bacterium DG_26]|uniref:Dockerin domain-containing protein n=1 Tax=candidate division TA06 bacterium DG_26 TaxID=1703771 RepID=A0A0S7WFC6_UNCT6|nr:MAG: hypothetical protein AMJ40_06790 [candidate division TA06 bacterium DG_26]